MAPPSETNQIVSLKGVLCSFIAENTLPFCMGPKLIELAKVLADVKQVLSELLMCRKAVTYTRTHGVAKTISEDLTERLNL